MKTAFSWGCAFLVIFMIANVQAAPALMQGSPSMNFIGQKMPDVQKNDIHKPLLPKKMMRRMHGILAAGIVLFSMVMQPAFAETKQAYSFENRSALPVLVRELSEKCSGGACRLFLGDAVVLRPGEVYQIKNPINSRIPSFSVSSPGIDIVKPIQMDAKFVGYGNCYHSKAFPNQAVCQLSKKSSSRVDSINEGELIGLSQKSYQEILESLGSATFYTPKQGSQGIIVRDSAGVLRLDFK